MSTKEPTTPHTPQPEGDPAIEQKITDLLRAHEEATNRTIPPGDRAAIEAAMRAQLTGADQEPEPAVTPDEPASTVDAAADEPTPEAAEAIPTITSFRDFFALRKDKDPNRRAKLHLTGIQTSAALLLDDQAAFQECIAELGPTLGPALENFLTSKSGEIKKLRAASEDDIFQYFKRAMFTINEMYPKNKQKQWIEGYAQYPQIDLAEEQALQGNGLVDLLQTFLNRYANHFGEGKHVALPIIGPYEMTLILLDILFDNTGEIEEPSGESKKQLSPEKLQELRDQWEVPIQLMLSDAHIEIETVWDRKTFDRVNQGTKQYADETSYQSIPVWTNRNLNPDNNLRFQRGFQEGVDESLTAFTIEPYVNDEQQYSIIRMRVPGTMPRGADGQLLQNRPVPTVLKMVVLNQFAQQLAAIAQHDRDAMAVFYETVLQQLKIDPYRQTSAGHRVAVAQDTESYKAIDIKIGRAAREGAEVFKDMPLTQLYPEQSEDTSAANDLQIQHRNIQIEIRKLKSLVRDSEDQVHRDRTFYDNYPTLKGLLTSLMIHEQIIVLEQERAALPRTGMLGILTPEAKEQNKVIAKRLKTLQKQGKKWQRIKLDNSINR